MYQINRGVVDIVDAGKDDLLMFILRKRVMHMRFNQNRIGAIVNFAAYQPLSLFARIFEPIS
jgi:hypothetical protein